MDAVDHVTITVKAGNGGAGASSFRREKFVPRGGPDGGDGGKGGDVILRATKRRQTLLDLKVKKIYKAHHGMAGQGRKRFGSDGDDCIIDVPIGTMVFDEDNHLLIDLCYNENCFVVAKGGKGGRGNSRFSSSINRSPQYAQKGLAGNEKTIRLDLRLIAEVGLVGQPNVGKSTLLNALTRAHAKVGDYPFTTLYPNLGTLEFDNQEIVVADIPGLIEGASQGAGLGDKFLRHVHRTRLLVMLIEAGVNVDQCIHDYDILKKELAKSEFNLVAKPCLVALSKIDCIDEAKKQDIMARFQQEQVDIIAFSSMSKVGLDALIKAIYEKRQHLESISSSI